MTVTKVSWEQVKELLHEAMQIAPEQRVRFLDEACSSNDSLRAEVDRRVLGEEHPQMLISLGDLALLYRGERQYEKADALFASVLETRRRALGPNHRDTTGTMVELAEVRLQEENSVSAESLLREAVDTYEKTASDSWERWQAQSLLGASLAGQSKYAESETLLVSGLQGMIDHQA